MQLRRKEPKMKRGGGPNRHRYRLFIRQKQAIPEDGQPLAQEAVDLRSWYFPENYSLNQIRVKPEQFFHLK